MIVMNSQIFNLIRKLEKKTPMIMKNKENNKLRLGNFSISKPTEWDKNNVKLEISDYDYDSTNITIEDLKILYEYIGNILKTN